jgi:hypothetical protein
VRQRGREEHRAEQQAGDRRVARQRDAFDRRQQQRGRGRYDQRQRHPAMAARRKRRLVARLERRGGRHRGRLACGTERGDEGRGDAEREERQRLHGVHRELRRDAAEVACAEVGAEGGKAGAGNDDAERHAERRTDDADESARQQRRRELLAHRHAHRVQQRDLAAAARHGQRLRRVHEERAGEERHQRECREVRTVGERQAHRVVARLAGRREAHAGRQQCAQRVLHRERVGARHQPQVHAVEPAETIEPPLRGRDVEHAERLPVLSGRQQPGDAQAHGVERDLHLETVAHRKVERLRRRRTQPHCILREQARALRGRGACRREPGLQPRRTERIDPHELERALASGQPRLRLDHGARHGDAGHGGESRVQRLVEAEARRLHGEVGHAEQAARGELHLVRGDPVDEVHGEAERDAERDGDDGQHGASQAPA